MEKPEEFEAHPEFIATQYWARPTGSEANADDILKEIEQS